MRHGIAIMLDNLPLKWCYNFGKYGPCKETPLHKWICQECGKYTKGEDYYVSKLYQK